MFLYNKGTTQTFAQLAAHHCERLFDWRSDNAGSRHLGQYSITKLVTQHTLNTDGTQLFFQDLQQNNFSLLNKILSGTPDELKQVINVFSLNTGSGRYPSLSTLINGEYKPSKFADDIGEVFNYTAFSKKKKVKWCAYDLCEFLNIDVCPYCNRNFTFTLKVRDNGVVRPELDHFLPKAKYPYLALSFYNLIPSCHICNSNLKHAHEFDFEDYLHPFLTSFDDIVRFSVRFKNKSILKKEDVLRNYGVEFFYGDTNGFNIVIKSRRTGNNRQLKQVMKNIRVFRIRELYNRHKSIVQEIIQSSLVYTDEYIESFLTDYNGVLFRNREDVLRHLFRNYPDPVNIANRTFSKLTRDIYEEFGIRI